MKITPKANARKWTKERLKLHLGEWVVDQEARSVPCWQGEIAIRCRNLNDGWSGWFPVNDIEVQDD